MKVLDLWAYFKTYFEEYDFPTLFFSQSKPPLNCSYQKITQAKLTNTNRKFAYHITNIFFKKIKILIHFILSSKWIHIQKTKLLGCVLIASYVSNNVNLNKILKFDLGYKELGHIQTSLDYLDQLHIDVFPMIRQIRPPIFFVTFTTCINNWPTLIETLK